jgi:hypothetical protein
MPSRVMTACMAVGLPLAAAMMHNLTHHSMKHRIKSRHGLFRPYCGKDDDALEGTAKAVVVVQVSGLSTMSVCWLLSAPFLLA